MSYETGSPAPEYPPEGAPGLTPLHRTAEAYVPAPDAAAEPTTLVPTEQSALDAQPESVDAEIVQKDAVAALRSKMLRTPEAEALPAGFNPWHHRSEQDAVRFTDAVRQAPIIGKYMLVGGHVLTDEYREKMLNHIIKEQQKDRTDYPHTVELIDAELEASDAVKAGAKALSEQLGVSIESDNSHVYVFDTLDHLQDVEAEIGGRAKSSRVGGFYANHKGIFLARENHNFTRDLAHETAHASSVAMYMVRDGDDIAPMVIGSTGKGYKRPDILTNNDRSYPTSLDEAVVQLAGIRMLKESGYDRPFSYSHAGSDILLDAMIQYTADEHGKSPQEIDDALVKGLFNGDLSGVQLIRETLDPAQWKYYASLGPMRINQMAQAALKLGGFSHPYFAKIAVNNGTDTRRDGKFRIYDWLR